MKDYAVTINGHRYEVKIKNLNESTKSAQVVVNGVKYEVGVEGMIVDPLKSKPQVASVPVAPGASNIKPVVAKPAASAEGHALYCPLPGTVVDIKVNVGDSVAAGQTLIVLEAMKMENNLDADVSGTIKEIRATKGATVAEGEILIVIG